MKSVLLQDNTIHIWKIPIDKNKCPDWRPHPQDIELAGKRFASQNLQKEYLNRLIFLRHILSFYMGDCAQQSFLFTLQGKPYIPFSLWRFNLSHSDNYVLIAVAKNTPIGVDIEKLRSDIEMESMASFFMDEMELHSFRKMNHNEMLTSFFDLWVQKEAYGKMLGVGLTEDPRNWAIGFSKKDITSDLGSRILLFSCGEYRAAVAYQSQNEMRIEFINYEK